MSVPKRVLIAVDESHLRRVICSLLEREIAVEVCGVTVNGAYAVEKDKELNSDKIVLGDSMPRMDGIVAGTDLRAMLAETPVILFTGDNSLAVQSAAMSSGIWAVVPKPEISRLARRLEFLLDRNVKRRNSPGP